MEPSFSSLLLILALTIPPLLYLQSFIRWSSRIRRLSLPPGPKRLLFVGNIFDMPKRKPWLGFRDLRTKHGDLVYLNLFGSHVLLIGSASKALELLDKRSSNTPDRPPNPLTELSGQGLNIGMMRYGDWWRRHRRSFWQEFRPGVLPNYHSIQRTHAHHFLSKLLESPSKLKKHIRSALSASMLKIIYDIDVQSDQDPRITIIEDALESSTQTAPGDYMVELFPFLRHVPSWFPGGGFQKSFAKSRAACDLLKHRPFDELVRSLEINDRVVGPCVAANLLARSGWRPGTRLPPDEEDIMKNVSAMAFEAGSDTTFSTMQGLFLALSLYPDVLKKAQDELDEVVGPRRLPEHSDRGKLVYIDALVKEALRWHVVLPLGIAHSTLEDDEFYGYFIPAGTAVMVNVWEIMHDPKVYDHPHEFRPDRFIKDGMLDSTVLDPAAFVFGFGRRICAGRHFAETSLFINIASVLHVFDIGPPVDEKGMPIRIVHQQSHGIASYPEDCRCTIKPRSARSAELIRDAMNA